MTTDIDPVVEPGSSVEKSLGYAIGTCRIFDNVALNDTSPHGYNVELLKTYAVSVTNAAMFYRAVEYGS